MHGLHTLGLESCGVDPQQITPSLRPEDRVLGPGQQRVDQPGAFARSFVIQKYPRLGSGGQHAGEVQMHAPEEFAVAAQSRRRELQLTELGMDMGVDVVG